MPTKCVVETASTHSIRVACQAGSDRGANQSFVFTVFNRTRHLVLNATVPTPTLTAQGLEPGREYSAGVYAFNSRGRSASVNLTLHSIDEPLGQPTMTESGNNNNNINNNINNINNNNNNNNKGRLEQHTQTHTNKHRPPLARGTKRLAERKKI